MQCTDEQLSRCAQMLRDSRSLTVSTGAGISKESGIPTFRDAQEGLWAKYDPHQLATPEGFRRDPNLVWQWYNARRKMIGGCEPNPGHYALAELEQAIADFTLITQNIDNLHRQAGSKNIVEFHGNVFRFKCFEREHPAESAPEDDPTPPLCHCGSPIRPDVVWFGEVPSQDCFERSARALDSCDLLLVVGTSGTVYPAAAFPAHVKQNGARVIEVNPELSAITPLTDEFLQGPSGEVLPRLVEKFLQL